MLQKVGKKLISRGTTPLIKIRLPILKDITPVKIWITFANYETYEEFFTIDENDIEIEDIYMTVRLTQAQTLLLESTSAYWQIRIRDSEGIARASRPQQFLVGMILKDGEI